MLATMIHKKTSPDLNLIELSTCKSDPAQVGTLCWVTSLCRPVRLQRRTRSDHHRHAISLNRSAGRSQAKILPGDQGANARTAGINQVNGSKERPWLIRSWETKGANARTARINQVNRAKERSWVRIRRKE
eukprot:1929719-Rhodomonas_salina.2